MPTDLLFPVTCRNDCVNDWIIAYTNDRDDDFVIMNGDDQNVIMKDRENRIVFSVQTQQ